VHFLLAPPYVNKNVNKSFSQVEQERKTATDFDDCIVRFRVLSWIAYSILHTQKDKLPFDSAAEDIEDH